MIGRLDRTRPPIRCLVVCNGDFRGDLAYRQRALTMARHYEDLGCQTTVLWLARLSNLSGSEVKLRHHWLGIPVPPFSAGNLLICKASRSIIRLLVRIVIWLWHIELVIAESPRAAAICVRLGAPVICDFHGDLVEEMKMTASAAWQIRLSEEDERLACHESVGWMCASHTLQQVLCKRYSVSVPAVAVSCCVDIPRYADYEGKREEARANLGLNDRWVVCYVGGLAKWQEIPKTLKLVKTMRSREPQVFFLFITRDNASKYASELAAIGKEGKDYRCLSLTHDEVLEILPAADLGVLLRASSPVNLVSSPTKCGEYLASGVPVLTTAYAGDASSVIAETCAGFVLRDGATSRDDAELAISFLRISMADRASVARRSHLAAVEHYNTAHGLESIRQLLKEVLFTSLDKKLPGIG